MVLALILVVVSGELAAQRRGTGVSFRNKPLTSREWSGLDQVDLAPLEEEMRNRDLGIPDQEIANHLRRNFQFIFVNKLNNRRFLVRPSPQRIADSIAAILSAEKQLAGLVAEARQSHGTSGPGAAEHVGPGCKRSIDQITAATRELRKLFGENFVEVKTATFHIHLPATRRRTDPVPVYLHQADRIQRMLRSRIDRYFFGPAPGSVSVADFEDVSVTVLADALIQLGRRVAKML